MWMAAGSPSRMRSRVILYTGSSKSTPSMVWIRESALILRHPTFRVSKFSPISLIFLEKLSSLMERRIFSRFPEKKLPYLEGLRGDGRPKDRIYSWCKPSYRYRYYLSFMDPFQLEGFQNKVFDETI